MVYLCRTTYLEAEQCKELLRYLSAEEAQKASAIICPASANSYIQSHAFKRIVLAKLLGKLPESLVFYQNDHGKPFIANQSKPLFFNLSHTQGLTALITSDNSCLGVDVEPMSERDFDLIKTVFYHADELAEFAALVHEYRKGYFYRTWVVKEAFLKAQGTGFATDPTTIKILSKNNGSYAVECAITTDYQHLVRYVQHECFALAYCDKPNSNHEIVDATEYLFNEQHSVKYTSV